VDSRVMACDVRDDEGSDRCLPAWTRRREEAGKLVRRARREWSVATVVDLGMVMGKAGRVISKWLGRFGCEVTYCRQRGS
jgi:hypothetical protein